MLHELEECARDYKIFIDTCSLLDLDITKFWNNIIPLLQQYNNKVIIPLKVIEELKKHKLNERLLA
jgi:rRNA-processing protein FCF1